MYIQQILLCEYFIFHFNFFNYHYKHIDLILTGFSLFLGNFGDRYFGTDFRD